MKLYEDPSAIYERLARKGPLDFDNPGLWFCWCCVWKQAWVERNWFGRVVHFPIAAAYVLAIFIVVLIGVPLFPFLVVGCWLKLRAPWLWRDVGADFDRWTRKKPKEHA